MAKQVNSIAKEEKLLNTLGDMHDLSAGSLSRIRGIARCMLRALETKAGARDLEAMAYALESIVMDVDITRDCICAEASKYGIETVDEAWRRRLHAMPKTFKTEDAAPALRSTREGL